MRHRVVQASADLNEFADPDSQVPAIRAEFGGAHGTFEGDVAEQGAPRLVDEEGPSRLINGQQEAPVRRYRQRSQLSKPHQHRVHA